MMALRGAYTLLLTLTWTAFHSSTLETPHKARIRVKRENAEFLSFNISDGQMADNLMLIHDSSSALIYAGGPHGLYMLKPGGHPAVKQVNVKLFASECEINPKDCKYKITLLKEGRNGNPLFMCGTGTEKTLCCDVGSDHRPVNCSKLIYAPESIELSLHIGDSLYYTISSPNNNPCGLYRDIKEMFTWPVSTVKEQKYVKIFKSRSQNQGKGSLDGKVYSFYIERNQNQDPDLPLWIPRVSQICTADRGGSKSVLQYRWTSMLTARLFCGDEEKHLSYTELLDVAVLEAIEWENTTIYGLFKNTYNLTAVCVYKMSDIINIFSSNEFKEKTETFSSRPGECVEDSTTLSPDILNFMEGHPEMKQWIQPARYPLMFNHQHYTHLLVDRVEKSGNLHHDVLIMSLETGGIHKILEQDGKPFIIAEYEPFKTRTHISSMLLDHKTKKLYVSSRGEVIQVDLRNCSMYGKPCDSCVMARDPYCGWETKCATNTHGSMIQDVTHGNRSICEIGAPKSSESKRHFPIIVPQDSKFYLKCPVDSQHASYAWEHQGRKRQCVSAEQDCLLLIDSMSEKDEGVYECVASENGYDRTIVHQALEMNAASETRTTHMALSCLLVLIFVIC